MGEDLHERPVGVGGGWARRICREGPAQELCRRGSAGVRGVPAREVRWSRERTCQEALRLWGGPAGATGEGLWGLEEDLHRRPAGIKGEPAGIRAGRAGHHSRRDIQTGASPHLLSLVHRYCHVRVPEQLLQDLLPGPVTLVMERTEELNRDLNPFTPVSWASSLTFRRVGQSSRLAYPLHPC